MSSIGAIGCAFIDKTRTLRKKLEIPCAFCHALLPARVAARSGTPQMLTRQVGHRGLR